MKCRSICSVTSKSAITPSLSGRIAEIVPGVRPSIRLASTPTACTSPVRWSIATTDGSDRTMPRPRTYTSVFAVPRSTAMSRPPKPPRLSRRPIGSSSLAGACGKLVLDGTDPELLDEFWAAYDEPEHATWEPLSFDVYGYSGLHYLRRIAA